MIRLFIAGEGPNELGDWARHPSYREAPLRPGVLTVLLAQAAPAENWRIEGAAMWKSLRKYQAGFGLKSGRAEQRNVTALMLRAEEEGVDVVAFSRDRDGDRDREITILDAVSQYAGHVPIVGGVAVERLESWLLALSGHIGSESNRRPEQSLSELGIGTTAEMVAFVEAMGIERIPQDANSLRTWLDRASSVLGGST